MVTGAAGADLGFETVTQYMSWDHDRLDALLESARSGVERGDWIAARRYFDDFQRGLDRHMRLEEGTLFPVFEKQVGLTGPTEVMRQEHGLVRDALAILGGAVGRGDARGFGVCLTSLLDVLAAHNAKEERILYPAADRALPEGERAALAAHLQEE
jgi:iron-sulfur cluster repair protein YtfE (RIC family)